MFGAVGAIFFYSINMTGPYGACGSVHGSSGYNGCSVAVLSVGVNGVLIGLTARKLCVAISALVSTIKVRKSFKRNENLSSVNQNRRPTHKSQNFPLKLASFLRDQKAEMFCTSCSHCCYFS